ncbi:MAG: hypothetical protein AAB731_02955 [Patescibacteria group bacterium]
MDILGHLWQTSALLLPLKEPKKIAQGALWGLVPDIIAFSPYVWDFAFGRFVDIPAEELEQYLSWAYPLGHGLPIFLSVFFLAAAVRYAHWASLGSEFYLEHRRQNKFRYFHLPMLGWGIHIILDSISHQNFLTPVFWPISNVKWVGIFNYSNNDLYYCFNAILFIMFFGTILIFYPRKKSPPRVIGRCASGVKKTRQ